MAVTAGAVGAVGAAITAFRAASDVAKAMVTARDVATFQAQMIEFQTKIIEANEAVMAAQEERSALLKKVGELEKEVAGFKAWNAEKQRHRPERLASGALVYTLKEEAAAGEPPHQICAICYQRGQKTFLQTVPHHVGRSESLLGSVSKTQPGIFTEGTFKIYLDFQLIFHGLPPRVAYLNGHDVPSVLERLAEQFASTVEAFASLSGH